MSHLIVKLRLNTLDGGEVGCIPKTSLGLKTLFMFGNNSVICYINPLYKNFCYIHLKKKLARKNLGPRLSHVESMPKVGPVLTSSLCISHPTKKLMTRLDRFSNLAP